MHRALSLVAACVTAAAILLVPTAAGKQTVGEKNNGLSVCEETGLNKYEAAHAKFGAVAFGANLIDDGTEKHDPYELPEAVCWEWTNRLDAMLNPPPPPEPEPAPVVEEASYSEPTYSAPAPASSSGGCPSYMAGEASSPDAVNPSSGAAGCWQVIPSTRANYPECVADVNSYGCLGAICAAEGNDAWVAADPCKAKLE
jgi:hypothetical protein